MKKTTNVLIASFLLINIFACSQHSNTYEKGTAKDILLDTVVVSNESEFNLPERRFIRTASLKTKVHSVNDALFEIENKTRAHGGYVGYSHFINNIQDSATIAVTKDSGLQIMHFTRTGFLTLRVPDDQMDSLLSALQPISTMMNNREIRADDVSISLLAGQLKRQRSLSAGNRLANDIYGKGRKLSEIEHAENTLEEKQLSADDAKISNLRMEDAVQYSTISMEIYQEPGILYTEILKEKVIKEYQQPFFSQMGESFSFGWHLLKDIVVALSRYWAILLMLLLSYILILKPFPGRKKLKTT